MNLHTPPKHKTPNYKLVRHARTFLGVFGRPRLAMTWTWEAQPLRATRKDLP